jgi:DNA-directed RNA polymerase specialized sigma24 family protein
MPIDSSGLCTMVYDHRPLVDAIDCVVPDEHGPLVGWARGLIKRYHVNDPAFGPEDAVQNALLKLWKAACDGKISLVQTDAQLVRLLRRKLDQDILDERDREITSKRTGPGAVHDAHCSAGSRGDVELDAIDSHGHPADDVLTAEDEFQWMLGRLRALDPTLDLIASAIVDGLTHREIAAKLGQSIWAVERKVRLIKAVLSKLGLEVE